jgi:hypothetical protein
MTSVNEIYSISWPESNLTATLFIWPWKFQFYLWGQMHFVTLHFGVKRTLGSDPKVRYTSHRTLGLNALWGQNREIDPKVRNYATYQRTLGSKVLKVSNEFCLNTEF